MARASYTQPCFLGGEFSPSAQGRLDLPQYRQALALCRNAVPTEAGPVTRRSGTRYIQPTYGGDVAANFTFAPEDFTSYTIEMTNDGTNTYFRFLYGSHLVPDSWNTVTAISTGNPAEITLNAAVTWATGDTIMIQIKVQAGIDKQIWSPLVNRTFRVTKIDTTHFTLQDALTGSNINGSAFGTIPSGSIAGKILVDEISSFASANLPTVKAFSTGTVCIVTALVDGTPVQPWTLSLGSAQNATSYADFNSAAAALQGGPYQGEVIDSAATLTLISGTQYTYVSSTSTFTSAMVGDPIRIGMQPGQWAAGYDYTAASVFVSDAAGNQWVNINATGSNVGQTPASSPNYWAPMANGIIYLDANITGYTNATTVTITLNNSLPAQITQIGTSYNEWQPYYRNLAYFSNAGIWPTCGAFFGGRAYFGDANNVINGTEVFGVSSPSTLKFNPTDQYGNVLDSSGISEPILGTGVNTIWWMMPDAQGILFGTQVSEWFIQSANTGTAITPTSFDANEYTHYGSVFIQPVRMGIAISFIDRFNARLFEYLIDPWSGRFSGRPLNVWSKQLTSGLGMLAYQDEPEPIIWANSNQGGLAGCSYRRISFFAQEQPAFYAWHYHTLGSGWAMKFLTNSKTGDNMEDQLYLITGPDSGGHYHHETLVPLWQDNDTLLTAWPVDEGVTGINYGQWNNGSYDSGPPRFEGCYGVDDGAGNIWFNGLYYFAGRTVSVWLGGLDFGDYVVSATGTITVPYASDPEHIGTAAYLQTFDKANLPAPNTAWYAEPALPSIPIQGLDGPSNTSNIPGVIGFKFTTEIQRVRPDDQQDSRTEQGPSQGDVRRHYAYALNVVAGVANTASIGGDSTGPNYPVELDNYKTGQPTPTNQLFTGIFRDTVDSDYDLDGQLYIVLTRPAPFSLASWTGFIEVTET